LALSVAVGAVDNVTTNSDAYFAPMWFLKPEAIPGAVPSVTVAFAAVPTEFLAAGEVVAKPITTIGIGRMHRSDH
jgi:hypothetical protein